LKYIFLSFINRSGSTYLANLLSKSVEICVCPEAEILYDLLLTAPGSKISKKQAAKFNRLLANDKKFMLWNIPHDLLVQEEKTGFENFLCILNQFRRVHYPQTNSILFKHNYLYNLVSNCNPLDFSFINLIREPRAVFASQCSTISPSTGKPMSWNVLSFTDSWNRHAQRILELFSEKNVITLKYEDLIENSDEVMNSLLSSLSSYEKWEDIKKIPPRLVKWISSDYKEIHPHIDELPLAESLLKWQTQVKKTDLVILKNFILKTPFYSESTDYEGLQIYWPYLASLRLKRKYDYLRGKLAKQVRNIFV
jgi:hypothetical protein